jgi:chemotaxis protein methyltransferase CheR
MWIMKQYTEERGAGKSTPTQDNPVNAPLTSVHMDEELFHSFSTLIQGHCGIKMPEIKRTMLESRLRKRLRHLGIDSFSEYWDYLNSPEGLESELVPMIDVVTTNKTDFFREPAHFDYLVDKALPDLSTKYGAGRNRPLNIWSAGCSTGKEPYTLAMILTEIQKIQPGFEFNILGTDLSTTALQKAVRGVYNEEKIAPVPELLKKRYIRKSKDPSQSIIRVCPDIRSKAAFRRLNFLDEDYGIKEKFDVVFFRNVIIYFDKENQKKVLTKICGHLVEGGYLFMGHAETLHSLGLPLRLVSPSVYVKI